MKEMSQCSPVSVLPDPPGGPLAFYAHVLTSSKKQEPESFWAAVLGAVFGDGWLWHACCSWLRWVPC